MDINVQKVYAHQVNKIRFPDFTLPCSTNGDYLYIYIYIINNYIYIYISYVHQYLQYDITYLIPIIYLYINNSNAWPTTPYLYSDSWKIPSSHPSDSLTGAAGKGPASDSDHAEE